MTMLIRNLLSGKDFNKLYNHMVFVKLTSENENHNGYQFTTGLILIQKNLIHFLIRKVYILQILMVWMIG